MTSSCRVCGVITRFEKVCMKCAGTSGTGVIGDGVTECYRVCTKENPYDGKQGRWRHVDAVDDGECSEGCCDYYKCPHCNLRFKVENPQ